MKRYTMNKRYCFFCVGTGGHIFPAKNLIKRLLESGVPEENIIIVSDKRGVKYFEDMTVEIIQKEFFISTRGIFGYLVNIGQFIGTVWEVYKELKTKKINTIVTTGAYIAPYAALISLILRSEFYVQEQNQYAGLGNRVASYFPSTVFESFPETKNLNRKNTIFTGPILNIDTKKVIEKNTNRNFTIGIQGGSQGSEEINQFIYKFIEEFSTATIICTTRDPRAGFVSTIENWRKYDELDQSIFIVELVGLAAAFIGQPNADSRIQEGHVLQPFVQGVVHEVRIGKNL